jgi:hypothetical protein
MQRLLCLLRSMQLLLCLLNLRLQLLHCCRCSCRLCQGSDGSLRGGLSISCGLRSCLLGAAQLGLVLPVPLIGSISLLFSLLPCFHGSAALACCRLARRLCRCLRGLCCLRGILSLSALLSRQVCRRLGLVSSALRCCQVGF